MKQPDRIQLDRVVVENYRSIKHCDVTLANPTFLVGRNGAGKSSFLDAIQFVQSAVTKGVKSAVADRNGVNAIIYRPTRFPAKMKFGLFFSGPSGFRGSFELHLDVASSTEFSASFEKCEIRLDNGAPVDYTVAASALSTTFSNLPPPPPDRLYISVVSGFDEFKAAYTLLSGLRVSEYSPKGSHLLSLNRFPDSYSFPEEIKLLVEEFPEKRRLVEEYLRLMVPNFDHLEVEPFGARLWVAFVEKVNGADMKFYTPQISDGTLYAVELLLDLFLRGLNKGINLPVLVEEPGGALHPWATGVLRSALIEASRDRQVIVTTHNPDLLDDSSIGANSLRAVYRNSSGTHLEEVSEGAISVLSSGLCTPGELFRRGALTAEREPEFVPFG